MYNLGNLRAEVGFGLVRQLSPISLRTSSVAFFLTRRQLLRCFLERSEVWREDRIVPAFQGQTARVHFAGLVGSKTLGCSVCLRAHGKPAPVRGRDAWRSLRASPHFLPLSPNPGAFATRRPTPPRSESYAWRQLLATLPRHTGSVAQDIRPRLIPPSVSLRSHSGAREVRVRVTGRPSYACAR